MNQSLTLDAFDQEQSIRFEEGRKEQETFLKTESALGSPVTQIEIAYPTITHHLSELLGAEVNGSSFARFDSPSREAFHFTSKAMIPTIQKADMLNTSIEQIGHLSLSEEEKSDLTGCLSLVLNMHKDFEYAKIERVRTGKA